MILGGRQGQDRTSVGDRQYASLLSFESFFDDHLHAGRAKLFSARDAVDGFERIVAALAHDHALARRQTVGFDDDRAAIAFSPGKRPLINRMASSGSRKT